MPLSAAMHSAWVRRTTTVVFVLLLPWPLYGLIAYKFLSEPVRMFVAFGCIGVEAVLGIWTIMVWTRRARRMRPAMSAGIIRTIVIALYSLFLLSVGYVYVFQYCF